MTEWEDINVERLDRALLEGNFTNHTQETEMKLTKEQAKMVIEFFSQKAAEDLPVRDSNWKAWDRHMWMTCYTASLAIERKINEHDWATLLNAQLDWQSFDRDAAAYLYERGEADTTLNKDLTVDILADVVSASIDTAFNTSKAA